MFDITHYCWRIQKVANRPTRLRLEIFTAPGAEHELVDRLRIRGLRARAAGTLMAERPAAIRDVGRALGAAPAVVEALEEYVRARALSRRGIRVGPADLEAQTRAAARVIEAMPAFERRPVGPSLHVRTRRALARRKEGTAPKS